LRGITIPCATIETERPLYDLLQETLRTLGSLTWIASFVEAVGPSAKELHDLSDSSIQVGTSQLMAIAEGLHQVIDGKFDGYRENDPAPAIVLDIVDSTYLDIWSTNLDLLVKLQTKFPKATTLHREDP
jgi:hypothetical protein